MSVTITRTDLSAEDLRGAARRTKDCYQARRLLAARRTKDCYQARRLLALA